MAITTTNQMELTMGKPIHENMLKQTMQKDRANKAYGWITAAPT